MYRAALSEGLLSAAELDLARALRSRVAVVGAAGPPPGGLERIQRKARTRQRNRMVLAGSAGVLMLAMAVTMATGDRFDLVPTLTGAVGLGGDSVSGDQGGGQESSPAVAAGNGDQTLWPSGNGGRTGLAIGPVGPVLTTPSAAAAARVPLCTAASLKTATTLGPTVQGVEYGHVDAVAQSPCVVVGPPVLTVANQAGTADSSVVILKEDRTKAALLPQVSTWGTTMVLAAGQAYQFQFAWDSLTCPQSASPSPAPSASAGLNSMYYLGYAVTGTMPTAVVTLTASCGAQVYVTDIYAPGAFPLPKVPAPPSAASSSPVAPPQTTPAPTPPDSTPPSASPSAAPSSSAVPNPGTAGGGSTGGGNATTPTG